MHITHTDLPRSPTVPNHHALRHFVHVAQPVIRTCAIRKFHSRIWKQLGKYEGNHMGFFFFFFFLLISHNALFAMAMAGQPYGINRCCGMKVAHKATSRRHEIRCESRVLHV
ncbi:hypothetical protein BDZ91DRAFT_463068 [Kalaharituber pfeilii]|nr:hypothetical protein BDZ91DRAFT_463068 [Kalaharituber pfeilii]